VPTNNLISYAAVRADKLYKLLGMAVTLDISDSGIRVKTIEPLPLAEELSFTVKLGDNVHTVRGRVVWGAEVEEDKQFEFGVKFKDLDFTLAKELWRVTEKLLQETPLDGYKLDGGDRPILTATAARRGNKTSAAELVLTIQQPDPPAFRERMPTPTPQGMVGHFEGDQLVEFVQMLGVQAKTGVVEIADRGGDHFLALRDGMIIAARTHEGGSGEEAIYRILSLRKGHFDFWPHGLREVKAEHCLSVQSLLLEVMRRRDVPSDEALTGSNGASDSGDETTGDAPDEGSS
jgi:hypothetical protein